MITESCVRSDTVTFKFIDLVDVIDERIGFELKREDLPPVNDIWNTPRGRSRDWIFIKKNNLKFIDWEKKEATICNM